MKWNWQQTDWPNWEFDSSKLQASEEAFLLHAGKLFGLLKYRIMELLDMNFISRSIQNKKSFNVSWRIFYARRYLFQEHIPSLLF